MYISDEDEAAMAAGNISDDEDEVAAGLAIPAAMRYSNGVLTRDDIETLIGPRFISDGIIDFYLTHLAAALRLPADALLVPPSVSFLLANSPDALSLSDTLGPLRLPDRELALFTVNDNADFGLAGGGLHWSLVVYERSANVFVHHDSLGGLNNEPASKLVAAVHGAVWAGGEGPAAALMEGPTPRQENAYDCGLYVMAIARAVCEWYADGACQSSWFPVVTEEVNAAAADELRGDVLRFILRLARERR